jgi:hypothetical protein
MRRTPSLLMAAAAALLATPAGAGDLPPLPGKVGTDLVRAVDLAGEGAFEIVVGPVQLPAGLPHVRLPIQIVQLPFDGWLHGFTWKIKDKAGSELPDDLLHHINLIDPDRRELFDTVARRVVAAGRETKVPAMPRLIGYPVAAGTRFLVASMFANPTKTSYDGAYLHVRLVCSRKGEGLIEPRDVYPFQMDVMSLVGPKDFPVPPGRTVKSWEASPAIDAWILGLGGHLHDFATELRLEDATDGNVIWKTAPILEGPHHVVGVPSSELWWKGGVKIRKDHRYRVTVVYENPTGKPSPHGGMGVVAGVVLAPDAQWPPLDRADRSYVADLKETLELPFRKDHHHGAHGSH